MGIHIKVVFDNPHNIQRHSCNEIDIINSECIFDVLNYIGVERMIGYYLGAPFTDSKRKPEIPFEFLHIETPGEKKGGNDALIVFDKRTTVEFRKGKQYLVLRNTLFYQPFFNISTRC